MSQSSQSSGRSLGNEQEEADVCAACHSKIQNSAGKCVIYGMDHKFCTEGCRCVFFFGNCAGGEGYLGDETEELVGKKCCECPCFHCDASCPHFSSFATGLVRNKWGFNKFVCKEDSLDGSETCTLASGASTGNLIRL
mmetsp:Transcript_33101/g.78910  ORF Transcript_33101/g.78910 Transcript_33101/m.78910 type:complete len:138 (-) Transcript_33101:761-1174(-)